jgi:energy-coupling factor transporter ATP-binding protein EcfA2
MAAKKSSTSNSKRRSPQEPESTATGAYFLSLTLQNIRCFGEEPQTLDLTDNEGRPARWTILLGNNGTGKTTILQALAGIAPSTIERGSAYRGFPESHRPRIVDLLRNLRFVEISPFLEVPEFAAWMLCRSGAKNGGSLIAEVADCVVADHKSCAVYTAECLIGANGSIRFNYGLNDTDLQWGDHALVCFGYGAGRRLGRFYRRRMMQDSCAGLFFDDVHLADGEDWLRQLDYGASKTSKDQSLLQARFEQVRRLLIDILPDVDDIRISEPTKEYPQPSVEFKTPYGWVPLGGISYGYQTMIAWLVDFASRMVDQYPDSANPLHEPAVVLVDEIDLHLHPKWQRAIVGYLTERFPNTQFIVTAHSPLVVQAATDANIVLLRREQDRVVIDNGVEAVRGWRVDQIYTSELFDLPSARPPELDDLLEKRKRLLTKSKLSKTDKKHLAEIEAQIGPLPAGESAEQAKSMQLIEQSVELLKKHQMKS